VCCRSRRRTQAVEGERDEPAYRRLRRKLPSRPERVDAVAGELAVRNIVPNVTIRGRFGEEVTDQPLHPNETRTGHWEARCQCGVQYIDEPVADRVPLDPLDPKTSCHLPWWEFAAATDPAVLRVLLGSRPVWAGATTG
jgi:hypothetical protein